MKKTDNNKIICFLYGTVLGRFLLKLILYFHIDRPIVRYLRSPRSKRFLLWYVRKNAIPLSAKQYQQYHSFRDFFVRDRKCTGVDITPEHLISPCDGFLSVYSITENCSFKIKGSQYRIEDLLTDKELTKRYQRGICLVFRLSASDNHHYCYIDDGYQGISHYIEGQLHSVQPIACGTFPVFTLNRRCWCLLVTENFGPVIQTEIGALIVGGIINREGSDRFCRGFEKGHFELAGSTIVLLFEPQRIQLLPEIEAGIDQDREVRVELGIQIGNRWDAVES